MIKNTVRVLLIFISLYLFYQLYFNHQIANVIQAKYIYLKCYCFQEKHLISGYMSLILPTYFYQNESVTLNSNGSKKLKYCEKRSKSLHYDFKETLDSLLLSNQKIFIAIMLHNNEATFPDWFSEFQRLINFLKPINPFVSILESQSRDLTPMW